MGSYDPSAHGAKCSLCPLQRVRIGDPVGPEWPDRPLALAIGANPGPEEVKKGRPFIGQAGLEFMRGLASIGVRRSQLAITNAILCCPPGAPRGALERFNHELQKENKGRAKQELDPIPTPLECCRPRLMGEIAALPSIITLGGTALHSILGHAVKVMDSRGGPRSGEVKGAEEGSPPIAIRLLPTLHPSFVMSSRRWRGAFLADLGRAIRWFTSGLDWKEPRVLYRPTPTQLSAFLDSIRQDPFSVYDVETFPGFREQDHYDPMFDRLKCIGIGVERGLACVVPFRSIESENTSFYTEVEKPHILRLLKNYLTSPLWKKAGWNSGYYDLMVVKHRLGTIPKPHLDGMILSRLAEPELPHGLGFAGSIYTDVDNWKQGHVATEARSDRELHLYNAKDCVVTAMAIPRLAAIVKERKQDHLVPYFAKNEATCVGLHENGLYIDQNARRAWDRRLLLQANEHRKRIQELAAAPSLNPASFPQIADLLFERLGIAPYRYTDLGDPSTDDDSLRKFLSETWGLDPKRKDLIKAIRDFRRVTKRRGVVVRLRPITEGYYAEPFLVDFEETEEERAERIRRIAKGKNARASGFCLPDGRVHGDWLFHGTVGWRFSSSGPNCQNVTDVLRDIFTAALGHVLVGCDEAQLELRMVAGMAKCKYYLDSFAANGDPHKNLCVDTFHERFENAGKAQQKKLRRSVKELTYSGLYDAGDETKLEVVTSAEDENEAGEVELVFPDFTLREVSAFTESWHRRCPEIKPWWEGEVESWKRQGFLAEPILGLKRDFLDGEDRNEILNYRAQSGGAALCHLATYRALERIPFFHWGPGTGMVQQGHDSIVFEVPADHLRFRDGEDTKENPVEREFGYCQPGCRCKANRVARFLEECMKEDGKKYGLDVNFLGEAKVGKTWKQV